MSLRSFRLNGAHSTPREFKDYVAQTIKETDLGTPLVLHLTAERIDLDELSKRRQKSPESIEFDFTMEWIGFIADSGAISGFAEINEERQFLQIQASPDDVQFDLLD